MNFYRLLLLLCLEQAAPLCYLQKRCSKLPKLTHFWRLMSGQEGIPVEKCFRRFKVTFVGDSRMQQLRHILNSYTT